MNEQDQDWETLIASRMRPCVALKIEDAAKRNTRRQQLKWKHEHREQENERQRKWMAKNPDKVKEYQQRAKPAIKKWAEDHHDRKLELNRKSDRKRATDPKRIAWKKEYLGRPEVKAKMAEYDRKRNQTPERKEYERLRSRRRRLAKFNAGFPSVMSLTLQDIGLITVHLYKEFR